MIDIHKLSGRLGNEMFRDAYIYAQMKDGMIPDIYLQSEKYWSTYADEIKARYRAGPTVRSDMLPYVAIHVRRGDYIGNPFYVDLLKTDYYQKAMAEFPGAEFILFSDDIEVVKNLPLFENCHICTVSDPALSLSHMIECKGHIIANSSFSWWGAYLSPHGGKVVAPKQWHPDGVQRTELPSKWIQV